MSRLARVPISLGNVQCKVDGDVVMLTMGTKNVQYAVPEGISVSVDADGLHCKLVDTNNKDKFLKSLLGTTFRNLSNAVIGLVSGFSKKLTLVGVGYKVAQQGSKLTFMLGKSHNDIFEVPAGIEVKCPDQTTIIVSGIDKQLVGHVCAKMIELRVPDAYKGKGVRDASKNYMLKEVKK